MFYDQRYKIPSRVGYINPLVTKVLIQKWKIVIFQSLFDQQPHILGIKVWVALNSFKKYYSTLSLILFLPYFVAEQFNFEKWPLFKNSYYRTLFYYILFYSIFKIELLMLLNSDSPQIFF